jgi:mannose-6-phosphate isomerase-like protein (cupin superfamily)
MDLYQLPELLARRQQSGKAYLEFLRVPALSIGVYCLPAGGVDPQRPHRQDEVYFVASGRASVRVGTEDRPVGPGSVVFVPALVEHRFHGVTEDLTLLVFFAPAETE